MASDLISRKALLEALEKKYDVAEKTGLNAVGLDCGFIITDKIIREQSTVDAAPVIHGTCETDDKQDEWYSPVLRCNVCGEAFMTSNDTANYCPDCGAKFDAGVQKYKIIKICKATNRRCKNCKRGSCVYRKEVKRWVKRKSFPKSQKEQ